MGIVLFQLLKGYFPVEKGNLFLKEKDQTRLNALPPADRFTFVAKEIKNLIKKGKLINLDTLPPYAGKDIRKILRLALHLDPGQRYQSAHDFSRDLHLYQSNNHEWWIDPADDNIHAYSRKKEKHFRITYRGKKLVIETSPNGVSWRKNHDATNVDKAIDYINNSMPN